MIWIVIRQNYDDDDDDDDNTRNRQLRARNKTNLYKLQLSSESTHVTRSFLVLHGTKKRLAFCE